MTKDEYLKDLFEKYTQGKISDEAYDQALLNMYIFIDDEEDEYEFI